MSATTPASMNETPITGTTGTDNAPPAVTPAPYNNNHVPTSRSRGPAGVWGRHPLVIASLETARHERHRRRVRGANYDLVVVDEAHRLRNHLTLGWKFVNDLNPRLLLLATATPVQNDLRELYNLATLVRPGTVGTFSQFRRNFLAGHDKRTPRNAPKLRSLLQSVMIRARRADTDIVFAPRRVETL